jgi:hypothetical protein
MDKPIHHTAFFSFLTWLTLSGAVTSLSISGDFAAPGARNSTTCRLIPHGGYAILADMPRCARAAAAPRSSHAPAAQRFRAPGGSHPREVEVIGVVNLADSHSPADYPRPRLSFIGIHRGNNPALPSTAQSIAAAYSLHPVSQSGAHTPVPQTSYEYSPDQSETAERAGFPGLGVLILFGCAVAVMFALGWIRRKTRLESGLSGGKTLSAYREV